MGNRNLKLVFMGTPEFAVASLEALHDSGFDIVGVITAPDKPAGRGMKLTESAVKKFAVEKGLKVLQPTKLKDPDFLTELRDLAADIQVIVAFRMLPEVVWSMPPLGTVNLHGSLLPDYRGAAPINWAIINGEIETGVTTFKLQHEIDTGNILMQQRIPIGRAETAGELHDRMKIIGAELLVQTIRNLADDSLEEIPQSVFLQQQNRTQEPKHAPKIFTETCMISWSDAGTKIFNLIRGLSPYPGAFTELDGKTCKIFTSRLESTSPAVEAGTYLTDGKTYLKFACDDGYIDVIELQLEGKKKMHIADFLRGYRFS